MRLLLSVHQGKPVAVLYDYRHQGANEPVDFTSVTTTRVDRLIVLNNAKLEVDRAAESYSFRASIPLEDIGFAPQPGTAYPGDFGIVYSDRAGATNRLRMHWSNQATGIVSDLSLEAAIQPQHWGRFEIVPQLK